ncbi:MAG: hypothetical protein HQL52_17630 [Magnetococcales bacterium]|nr:hypothetical protein [Magnetococcales bacterium]
MTAVTFTLMVAGWGVPATGWSQGVFKEEFTREDAQTIGNGWISEPNVPACTRAEAEQDPMAGENLGVAEEEGASPDMDHAPGTGHVSHVDPPLEIDTPDEPLDIEEVAGEEEEPLPQMRAEIQDERLFLHYEDSHNVQVVRRTIDKRVSRLVYDFTPLYAMGGLDDRAWIGVRIRFLDGANRPLGEIRNFYYNVVYEEYQLSNTVFSTISKGPFDGGNRHALVETDAILRDHLPGVPAERVVRTELSFEIASPICGASVEGYIDNIVAILGDGSGLYRFSRTEILDVARKGGRFHATDRDHFPGNWIDYLHQEYGQEKIDNWLGDIPDSYHADTVALVDLMGELFGLTGEKGFLAASAVSLLLQSR